MTYAINQQRQAFLSMIAYSEGTPQIPDSDDGYRAIVGGATFYSYADHPRVRVWIPSLGLFSTAAGRYQVLEHYFDVYKQQLMLPDFGHDSQDQIALQLINECHALDLIDSGHIADAIT